MEDASASEKSSIVAAKWKTQTAGTKESADHFEFGLAKRSWNHLA
jgi:hypothetical protein